MGLVAYPWRAAALALLCAAIASSPRTAMAQSAPRGEFSVLRYSVAPGPNNYFQVDGARVYGELEGSAGAQLDYAHNPFTLYQSTCAAPDGTDCQTIGTAAQIVQYTMAAHLWGAIALASRVQIGLIAPLVLTSGESFEPTAVDPGRAALLGGSGFALADPRLHIKVNIYDDRSNGLILGVAAWVSAPLGQAIAPGRFVGDEQPSFGGHFIGEWSQYGVHVAGNLGGVWRDGDTLYSTVAGSQLTYGLAGGYEITPLVYVFAELVGATSFTAEVDENPLEARLGGRLRVDDVSFELGVGAGLVAGVGVPMVRALGGFAWAPQRSDADNDGIGDELDGCPAEPEDVDGFNDEDGCPELDNDDDGIPDARDQCPDSAEDMDGDTDDDGCPDGDADGDGIHDGYDSCPNEPEDMDGDRDEDGCPDDDRDRDSIPDDVDQCPEEPEDTDGLGDEDGCPEVDFDDDGVPDDGDQCPEEAEDRDDWEDDDGCPEEGALIMEF